MDNDLVKQSDVKIVSDFKFSNAIISEIELKNGQRTQVVVIFNNSEVNFEEMNVGIKTTMSRCMNVGRSKNTFCSIKNGMLKPFAMFHESAWKH
jgi:hypothetical protein